MYRLFPDQSHPPARGDGLHRTVQCHFNPFPPQVVCDFVTQAHVSGAPALLVLFFLPYHTFSAMCRAGFTGVERPFEVDPQGYGEWLGCCTEPPVAFFASENASEMRHTRERVVNPPYSHRKEQRPPKKAGTYARALHK